MGFVSTAWKVEVAGYHRCLPGRILVLCDALGQTTSISLSQESHKHDQYHLNSPYSLFIIDKVFDKIPKADPELIQVDFTHKQTPPFAADLLRYPWGNPLKIIHKTEAIAG